jgi:uncharacterized protein (TIGR02266 family)
MLNDARPRREAEFARNPEASSDTSGERAATEAVARREHSRFSVDLDVTVSSEHNFYAGFVENMSVGGIFIATHQLKPVGERLEFSVHLPGHDAPIRGVGEVRWVRVYSEASNVPPGMGIKFDPLDAASQRAIEDFLAQRDPLFYDED